MGLHAAHAQTAPLNDTGQTKCYARSTDATDCASANAAFPGQDARFGRDAAQVNGQLKPAKSGGGNAGFDFTALEANGTVTTTLGGHECVRDNVTRLIWSTESILAVNWEEAGARVATYKRCGHGDWRLPTRRELLSIVDYARSMPAIDSNYFPNTRSGPYWTSEMYANFQIYAWMVDFTSGESSSYYTPATNQVRLVRSGQ